MSITKNLVEMFKGEISIESELGEGTTFHVDIKFEQGELALAEIIPGHIQQNTIAQRNVLLVEDNPVNQMVAMKMLSKWDCHVGLASDGKIAIEMLDQQPYDIVLMDLQMPNMGGIEATTIIRQSSADYAQIPIIAMTAHNSKEHVQECYDAGMQAHIAKPIDRNKLEKMLLTHIPWLTVHEEHEEHGAGTDLRIEGIDIQNSLLRVNGDWPLLYQLIVRFLSEQLSAGDYLLSCKQNNNLTDAVILLHKIKGGAANIGMMTLSAMAGKFEDMLNSDAEWPSNENFEALQKTIETLNYNVELVDNPTISDVAIDLRVESIEYIKRELAAAQSLVSKDLFATEDKLNDLLACQLDDAVAKALNAAHDAMLQFNTIAVSDAIAEAIEQLG